MAKIKFNAIHPITGEHKVCIRSKIPGMMKFADGTREWCWKLKDLVPAGDKPSERLLRKKYRSD